MEEIGEKPLFKFKKAQTKKVGDFDVMDTTEWTLLIKPQIQDVTLFVHFHKLWNVQEVPGVVADEENGIEGVEPITSQPIWQHNMGFIKDDKFIVTQQKNVSDQTFHTIHKRYIKTLQNYLNEGYVKDESKYVGDEPMVPAYYINEKTPQSPNIIKMQGAMSGILRGNGTQAPAMGTPGAGKSQPKTRRSGIFQNLNLMGKKSAPSVPIEDEDS